MAGTDEKEAYKLEFIERVRRARASTGQTQLKIAAAIGVEQDDYKHWESKRLIPHHLIWRFCFACGVDPIWLITGHGRMKQIPPTEPPEPKQRIRKIRRRALRPRHKVA